MADVEVMALRPFLHGRIRAKSGDRFTIPEREARDLERAGLIRRTNGTAPEPLAKKAASEPSGPPAPLFALPPAPPSLPLTSSTSAAGDSPEPRRRGRPTGRKDSKPRKSRKAVDGSSSPT